MNHKIPLERIIMAVALGAMLLFGIVFHVLTPDATFSPEENRNLQQLPKFTLRRLYDGDFAEDFESYLADQFPSRDFFIGVKADLQRLSMKTDNNGVYFGREGFLFESLKEPDQGIIEKNIEGLNLLAATTGKKVAFIPVPSAAQMLPQLQPPFAPQYDQSITLETIRQKLSDDVKLGDLFGELSDGARQYYYRTDHHWNEQGAYVGYVKLCELLGIEPFGREDFTFELVSEEFRGTLYSTSGYKHVEPDSIVLNVKTDNPEIPMTVVDDGTERDSLFWRERLEEKDQYTVYGGGNHALVVTHNEQGNGRKLLLIKDSYAHVLLPYLAANYSEVHMMDLRYYATGVYDYIEDNGIDDIAALYSMKTFGELVLNPLHMVPKD